MRIGIYAGSLRPGGGLTALKQLMNGLRAIGIGEVVVFTGARDTSEALQPYFVPGSPFQEQRFLPGGGSMRRHLASKWAFRGRRAKFDLLITVNYDLPASCPVAVYHLNLLSFLASDPDSWSARWKRWDARRACRRASQNWFESRYLLDQASQAVSPGVRNASLLYLGVHEDFYAKTAPDLEAEVSADLLLVSSIQPHKDNLTALRTLAELIQQRPEVDWRLRIAGGQSVDQWSALSEVCRELAIEHAVEFLGPLSKKELSQRMQDSLCLINPSRIESFCMVALEAMASYCPSIVTDSTSMPESVGEAALIVTPGDAKAFTDAVLKLYDSAELRWQLIQDGRARAEDFSAEEFGRQLRKLISR